jgi:hypothetical protein
VQLHRESGVVCRGVRASTKTAEPGVTT